jgi:hypothetical protein
MQFNHAETVGSGVHRQRVAPGPPPKKEDDSAAYSLDGPVEWGDKPTFPDQVLRGTEFWKTDRVEVKIFDLSQNEQIESYAKLLSEVEMVGVNKTITFSERKYCEETANWKVMLEITYIKFRQLLRKKEKPA